MERDGELGGRLELDNTAFSLTKEWAPTQRTLGLRQWVKGAALEGTEGMRVALVVMGDSLRIEFFDSGKRGMGKFISLQSPATALGVSTKQGKSSSKLAVGMQSGDVEVCDLEEQICEAKKSLQGSITVHESSARCTALAWKPPDDQYFVAGFADGCVLAFFDSRSGEQGFAPCAGNSKEATKPTPTRILTARTSVCDLEYSPKGSSLAVATKDGVVTVVNCELGAVECGFECYYGAALCMAWTADGRLLAAGGECDHVEIFDTHCQRVVAWASGHQSFVSALAADPVASPNIPPRATSKKRSLAPYRLYGAGHDGRVIAWDVFLEADGRGHSFVTANGDCSEPPSPSKCVQSPVRKGDVPELPPSAVLLAHHDPISSLRAFGSGLLSVSCTGVCKFWWRVGEGNDEGTCHAAEEDRLPVEMD